MKSIEIIGFKRANLGKVGSKGLREESNVPCVLYGGKEQIHFHTPAFLFRDLVYTGDAHTVKLTIGTKSYDCILQDIQFHPVNDAIVHVDFLELIADKAVKMDIPVKFTGVSPGVLKGGKLIQKLKKIKVKALPANLPDVIEMDISGLDMNKSLKVGDIKENKFTVLNTKSIPVCTVEVTRAAKLEESATPAAAAAPAAAAKAPAAAAKK